MPPPDDGNEYAQIMDITPAMAQSWLENRAKNRPINQKRVDKYAAEMRGGRWRVTDEGIGFGLDGKLYDGEHRLWAVVEAGVTVRSLVVFNLTPEARKAINTGKSRRNAEILHMFGDVDHPRDLVTCANAIYRIVYDTTPALSTDDLETWYAAVRPDLVFGVDYRLQVTNKMRRTLGQAAVCGALVFAHRKHPAEIEEFAAQLAAGEGLKAGDPAHTLREFLLAEDARASAHTGRLTSLKTLRAAQYFVERERVTKLQAGEEGLRYFITAHTLASLPPPLISGPTGRVADADRVRYEAVKNETSMAKIVAQLRAGGVEDARIPMWCVDFQRYVPFLMQYAASEVERTARERLQHAGRTRKAAGG